MVVGDDPVSRGLFEQRRVMVSGPLDAATVTAATAQLMLLDGQSAEPVTVVVNSPGGALEDAVGLLDTLRSMRAPVTVEVLGQAHGSAGIVVAAAPGTRRAGSTASVSIRLARVAAPERGLDAEELLRFAEVTRDLERRIAGVIGTRSGQTIDWVLDQLERGSAMFGADALEARLIDEVR